MDNYIYDTIADYNDWVRLSPPAGISEEMQRAFKNKQIKRLIDILEEMIK